METKKVIVIGLASPATREEINRHMALMETEVLIIDDMHEAENLLGTSYPELKPPKPFVITAPPILERPYDDYQNGKERRRDRRAKARQKKKH